MVWYQINPTQPIVSFSVCLGKSTFLLFYLNCSLKFFLSSSFFTIGYLGLSDIPSFCKVFNRLLAVLVVYYFLYYGKHLKSILPHGSFLSCINNCMLYSISNTVAMLVSHLIYIVTCYLSIGLCSMKCNMK